MRTVRWQQMLPALLF